MNVTFNKKLEQLQSVRGTRDYIGQDAEKIHMINDLGQKLAKQFGFQPIITPIIEPIGVFTRSLGQTSDIVHKEMFQFQDRGGEELVLRPENTAAVARAFIQHGLYQDLPLKFFYHGAMFRYERPQQGRYRQFFQFGAEFLGGEALTADIEIIALAHSFLKNLPLNTNWQLEINSLGNESSRQRYKKTLMNYFEPYRKELSIDSQIRLNQNPLRILDSKDPRDKKILATVPKFHDDADTESQHYFFVLQNRLSQLGIDFVVRPELVRGLDYYCHTAFEFTTNDLGAGNTILAGGRYDGLISALGGKSVAGVGFAAGVDRLALLLPPAVLSNKKILFLCPLGYKAVAQIESLAQMLRNILASNQISQNYVVDFPTEVFPKNFMGDDNSNDKQFFSLKKILSLANKKKASHALIFGDDELIKQEFQLKNLMTGQQTTISASKLQRELLTLL